MITARLWFTKTGEASYISLLDLQRVMQRALKRSKIPVWYTQGFNPHIYMTFAAPLPLGQESLTESLDFRLEQEPCSWQQLQECLKGCLPKGIEVVRIEPAQADPAQICAAVYEISVPLAYAEMMRTAVDVYMGAPHVFVLKKGKKGYSKQLDLKPLVPVVECVQQGQEAVLHLTLPAGNALTVNPALLLAWLEEHGGPPVWCVRMLRKELKMTNGETFR